MQNRREPGFWPQVIIDALHALGGEADTVDVYAWTDQNVPLWERELEPSPHRDRPRYVHTIRSAASKLGRDGTLIKVATGRYRLP